MQYNIHNDSSEKNQINLKKTYKTVIHIWYTTFIPVIHFNFILYIHFFFTDILLLIS